MSSHACQAPQSASPLPPLRRAAAYQCPGRPWLRKLAPQAGTIEQVTVTARRREESLQDVPVAITALTADQLLEQNVRTLEDITAYAPNIKVNAGRATTSTINAYIRGVGQNDPLWGFEPGVGIYLDDVYIARPQGALLDVYDVERIEVLRGPQGTLYGKNTLAGAIKYVTRDIVTDDPAFNVTATGGSYDQRDIKIGGSAPVVADHVYLGAAVAYLRRDGYGELVNDGAPRGFNSVGQDVSDKDVLAARANATFVWGESSKLRVLADTVQDNSNAAGGQRMNNLLQPALNDRWDQRTDMPVDRDRFIAKGVGCDLYAEPQRNAGFQGGRRISRRRRPPVHRLRGAEREPVPGARRVQRRPDQRRSAAHLHRRQAQRCGRRLLLRRHGPRRFRRLARREQSHRD